MPTKRLCGDRLTSQVYTKSCLMMVTISRYSTVTELLLGFTIGITLSAIVYICICLPSQSCNGREYTNQNIMPERIRKRTNSNKDDSTIAGSISDHVKVLCWVLVKDGTFHKQAIHVNNTWGKRCDKLLFFGSTTNKTTPVINLGIQDGHHRLAKKTFAALAYVFERHIDDADWFLKADLDTYVIMENLRYFLSDEDTREAVWFGEHYNPYMSPWHYNSGGAGYVLSKEALQRFGRHAGRTRACTNANGPEDAALGYCLQTLNVKVGDTPDKFGRSRFHFDLAPNQIAGRQLSWYKNYLANQHRTGLEWLSDYPISFHWAKPRDLLALEYFLYTLRPQGVFLGFPSLNRREL